MANPEKIRANLNRLIERAKNYTLPAHQTRNGTVCPSAGKYPRVVIGNVETIDREAVASITTICSEPTCRKKFYFSGNGWI